MSLLVTKKFKCDICEAEYDEHQQQVTVRMVEQTIPHNSVNQIIYRGHVSDLCIMCMAPVHHAFMEQVEKIWAHRRDVDAT